ncbi:MAG: DUF4115 domain-containing protein [Melioribacteraceae bacterium]|nr:DUF4115 domain-containing protein [Melioribacteraceae bacterium]
MSTSLENFAKELIAKREEKNITINDIYERTRIDANYLREMEKGKFDFMPDVYVRAFIRKYADAIDFDPEDAIKIFEAALKGKSVEDLSETEVEGSKYEDKISNKGEYSDKSNNTELGKKSNNPIPIILILVVIVIVVLSYFLFFQKGNNEIIVEPKIEDILDERKVVEDTPRFEIKKENIPAAKEISKVDSLSLKINAIDTAWFRIIIDNQKNDEFILYPNRSKVLRAESEINLLLGNAGGIELILNGKNLNFTGKKGEIRNISIDADGFHYIKDTTKSND